jgi:hypothetical protein
VSTAVVVRDETTVTPVDNANAFGNESAFEYAQRAAKALALSDLAPPPFKGNISNCLAALDIAMRVRMSPLLVMQKLHNIQGKWSWAAEHIIAIINASGRFSPLRFRAEGAGDQRAVTAYARDLKTGDEVEGVPVSIEMAKGEGWFGRSGSKWKTMPELMLRYRAAAFFGRLYCPDLLSGLSVAEDRADPPMLDAAPLTDGRGNDGRLPMLRTPADDAYGVVDSVTGDDVAAETEA